MYDDNLFSVDTTGVQEMGGYEIFPSGLYPAIMVSATKKMTKNEQGAYLECVYQIIDGDFNGKKFTSRMNLWNENKTAVEIATRELKSLRVALGLHDQEGRTSEFVNKPLVLDIGVKPRKDKPSEVENNLLKIIPYSGAPAQVSQVANPAPAYQQPPQQFAPPPAYQAQPQQFAPPPAYQPNTAKPAPWMQGAR